MPFTNDDLQRFQPSWLSQMAAAVTVLDPDGRLLFYNDRAPGFLDRKPEYLGHPIQGMHQPRSAAKIDDILAAYRQGGREEYTWRLQRPAGSYVVRVAPWLEDGQCKGLIHVVLPWPEEAPAASAD